LVSYTPQLTALQQVLFWVRDHKPKLDQSAVREVTCICHRTVTKAINSVCC